MSRLLDKTIVLLICLALLVRGPVDAALVSWLCVAVTLACLGEVVPERTRPFLALALLTCGAFVSGAGAYLPLAAYDVTRPWEGSRGRWRRAPSVAAGALLVCVCVAGGAATAPLRLLCCGVACLLSVRATQAERAAASNRQTRDNLQGRALELAAKNRDLMDRQEYEVELATLAERARIAREIHDNVGHLLTRATLQVEALRVVHAGEPRVQADFADVGATLGEALDTVRASVHALREDSVDLSVQMRKVVADVTAVAPLAVELDVRCDRVPPNACSCLLAVTREALSNVLRHAAADRVVLRCVEHPGFFQLEVTDDGAARSAGGTAAGDAATGDAATGDAATGGAATGDAAASTAWPPWASASRRWAGPSGPDPARTAAGGSLPRCPRAAPGGERHENRNHRRRPSGL